MPAIVWICVIAASWLGGTCAQLSSVLNMRRPLPALPCTGLRYCRWEASP